MLFFECQANNVSAEAFAQFIFYYDSVIPEIDASLAIYLDEFSQIKMRKKQEDIASEITRKTVESLIMEYIIPLGLRCDYTVNGDIVKIDLEQRKKASLSVSIDQLADTLKDSDAIINSLKTGRYDIHAKSKLLNTKLKRCF